MKKGKNPIDQGELLRLEKAVTEAKKNYFDAAVTYEKAESNRQLLGLKMRLAIKELNIFRKETEK